MIVPCFGVMKFIDQWTEPGLTVASHEDTALYLCIQH